MEQHTASVCINNSSTPNLDGLSDLPVHWVRTNDDLYQLIDEIDKLDRVALDTEFIKRTTYFPILALVQINTGTKIYLVDAPRLDLADLWKALSKITEMIWYACGEDLRIFYLLAECPALSNVIDVQIGLAYLTGEMRIGYGRAVSEILGVPLAKTESRSDWLARPLTNDQQAYAVADVRYLLALYDAVKSKLTDKGLMAYVLADSQAYAKELYLAHVATDEQLYLSYSTPLYTRQQIAVLQAITAWRESVARKINKPCSFVISKQTLHEIATDMPVTLKALSRTTIGRFSLNKYGHKLILLIQSAKSLPANRQPPMPPPVYMTKNKPFRQELKKLVADHSQKTGIPENLLLKNRWLNEIMYAAVTDGVLTTETLHGYRHQWIVDEIMPLFDKHKTTICKAMGL